MRWLSYLSLLVLLGIAQALSSSGNRLLVVIEEASEKAKYSTFWGDLEGRLENLHLPLTLLSHCANGNEPTARGYKITFESPKNEKLSLFLHGERNYDHLLLLPPKAKGSPPDSFCDSQSDVLQDSAPR